MPVEKWISGLTITINDVTYPQPLWKTCGKANRLWKKTAFLKKIGLSTVKVFNNLWKSGKKLFNHCKIRVFRRYGFINSCGKNSLYFR